MFLRGGDSEVVAVAFERGRHQDGGGDACLVHHSEEALGGQRLREVRLAARRPRPLGRVRCPDVNLRVDDLHVHNLPFAGSI